VELAYSTNKPAIWRRLLGLSKEVPSFTRWSGIELDTALQLRKIQSSLRDHWAAAYEEQSVPINASKAADKTLKPFSSTPLPILQASNADLDAIYPQSAVPTVAFSSTRATQTVPFKIDKTSTSHLASIQHSAIKATALKDSDVPTPCFDSQREADPEMPVHLWLTSTQADPSERVSRTRKPRNAKNPLRRLPSTMTIPSSSDGQSLTPLATTSTTEANIISPQLRRVLSKVLQESIQVQKQHPSVTAATRNLWQEDPQQSLSTDLNLNTKAAKFINIQPSKLPHYATRPTSPNDPQVQKISPFLSEKNNPDKKAKDYFEQTALPEITY
jgi:hypothetical protein